MFSKFVDLYIDCHINDTYIIYTVDVKKHL